MPDKILYYPAINLPKNEWTVQSILYWDQVGVIVPEEFMREPEKFDPVMRTLIQDGAVRQHLPGHFDYLQSKVSDTILRVISQRDFSGKKNLANPTKVTFWKIHDDKFSPEVFRYLMEEKLAYRNNGNWYVVEAHTAAIMMTYLAAAIADRTESSAATDNTTYIRPDDHLALVNGNREKIRTHVLSEVMPYPKTTKISRILNFKERYGEDLIALRKYIEDIVGTSLTIGLDENRQKYLDRQIEKAKAKKEELIARYKEGGFKNIVTGAVKGMVVDAGISLLTGDAVNATATLLGAAVGVVQDLRKNPLKGEDLAFLALTDQRL